MGACVCFRGPNMPRWRNSTGRPLVMLLATLSVVTATLSGGATMFRLFFPKLSVIECAAAAAPIGLTLSAWLALLLKSFLFQSSPGIPVTLVITQVLLQLVVTWLCVRNFKLNKRELILISASLRALSPLLALVGAITAWFTYIFYTHSLLPHGKGYYVGGSTYGDMPFHLNIINSFLHGINSHANILEGFKAVFFADAKLVYPVIPDWHTAVLVASGASLHFSLVSVGVLLIASFLLLLLAFNIRLTGSAVASGLGVLLTLLCGGVGGFVWLFSDFTYPGLRQVDHILYVVNNGPASILWLSLPAHILLPQRTTQYAYPVALLCLVILQRGYAALSQTKGEKSGRKQLGYVPPSEISLDPDWVFLSYDDVVRLFGAAGLVAGLLPLLQAHSYVAVAIATVVVALIHISLVALKRQGGEPQLTVGSLWKTIELWLAFGVSAVAIGFPQLWLYSGKVQSHKRFARFEGVWVDQHEPGPHTLWPEALGLFVPLNILAFFVMKLKPAQTHFHIGLFAVFVVSNIIVFQPWEVDNTKLFYIWVFGASGHIGVLLERWWHALDVPNKRMGGPQVALKGFTALVYISLIFSGSLCMYNETLSFSEMYDVVDEEAGQWFVANTSIDARVATTSEGTHMRPESCLAGRQVLVGYPGWMDSHGMPWPDRNRDLMDLFKGAASGRQTIVKYNITHIVVDWNEVNRDQVNMRRLNAFAYRVASNGRYIVYQTLPQKMYAKVVDCLPGKQVTEELCSAKGCEWVKYFDGPWCQVPPVRLNPDTLQAEGGPKVEDCGRNGINKQQCEELGCSWYPHYAAGPWCHQPVTPPDAPPDVVKRHGLGGMVNLLQNEDPRDCGWTSIGPRECLMRGCYWKPYVRGPWCVTSP